MQEHPKRTRARFLIISCLLINLLALILFQKATHSRNASQTQSPKVVQSSSMQSLAHVPDRSIVKLTIADQPIAVEVVNTPASITLGLSGRSEIGHDGMLFVLPTRRIASFWMKDMLFDLDLVWIDDSTIVGVTANVPAPAAGLSLSQLPSYSSSVPVTHVLEVPAATAKAKGWTAGTRIML